MVHHPVVQNLGISVSGPVFKRPREPRLFHTWTIFEIDISGEECKEGNFAVVSV